MKVLLVATNRERSPYPVAPLGALCVAAAARNAGHEVDFLDMGLSNTPHIADLHEAIERDHYQAVAFGIRNLDNCWAFAPRAVFRRGAGAGGDGQALFQGAADPGRHRLFGLAARLDAAGGCHLRRDRRGRARFPRGAQRLAAGRSLEGIAGVLTSARNGKPVGELSAPVIKEHERTAASRARLCGYTRYLNRGGFVGVQTKRGCPLGCVYCIYPQLEGKRYRLRPPGGHRRGDREGGRSGSKQRHFFFVDSVFNDPRRHALAVCAESRQAQAADPMVGVLQPAGLR